MNRNNKQNRKEEEPMQVVFLKRPPHPPKTQVEKRKYKMKLIYTNSLFNYQKYKELPDEKVLTGIICVACDDFQKIEKVGVGRVEGLKQYTNIFEFIAIARAVELAIENKLTEDLEIFTDSLTAKTWAEKGMKIERYTAAHKSANSYFQDMIKNYPHNVVFEHIGREKNPAGKILEIEIDDHTAQ